MYRPRPLFVVLAITWALLIFCSSTTAAERFCNAALDKASELVFGPELSPDDGPPADHFWLKKTVHVTLFLIYALLLTRALPGDRRQVLLLTLLIGGVTGSLSEVLQIFEPGREPTVRDALINFCSCAAGSLLFSRVSLRCFWTRPAVAQ